MSPFTVRARRSPLASLVLGASVVAGCSSLAGIDDNYHTVGDASAAGGSAGTGGSAGAAGSSGAAGAAGMAGSAGTDAGDGGECSAGTKRCADAAVQTCSPSGTWGSAVACALPTPSCDKGQCVDKSRCKVAAAGTTDCGPSKESCCSAAQLVQGGTFYRSYDGTAMFNDQTNPAKVSNFSLDKYEVTVARFRGFVDAWSAGWRPAGGSGKHSNLNGGKGLVSDDGSYETGWSSTWDAELPSDKPGWDLSLQCYSPNQAWTPSPGPGERRPVECVSWYQAYAFCIWDGGFLPSDAEWNYAAAGGSQQRAYPWSNPATSTIIDCSYANYSNDTGVYCVGGRSNEVGSESPKGDGAYGHADLAGNVDEWTLDWYGPYHVPCDDCALLSTGTNRVVRGGGASSSAAGVRASDRFFATPDYSVVHGVRCARAP